MSPETAQTLSENPPPQLWECRYKTLPVANARYHELQRALGLSEIPKIFNLRWLNWRINRMESRLGQNMAAAAPEVATVSAPPAPPAPNSKLFGRARAAAAVKIEGSGRKPDPLAKDLSGRERMKAAMKIVGYTNSPRPEAAAAPMVSADENKPELKGRERMKAAFKLQV